MGCALVVLLGDAELIRRSLKVIDDDASTPVPRTLASLALLQGSSLLRPLSSLLFRYLLLPLQPQLTSPFFFSSFFFFSRRLRPPSHLLPHRRASLPTSLLHRPSIHRHQSFSRGHPFLGSDWAGTDRREEGRVGVCVVRDVVGSEYQGKGWELVNESGESL